MYSPNERREGPKTIIIYLSTHRKMGRYTKT